MRTNILNHIARQIGAKRYLEIGVHNAEINYNNIDIDFKIGVDPERNETHDSSVITATSDDFFAKQEESLNLDLVFVDGLHHWEQVVRDVENSIRHLNRFGVVMLHDTTPYDEGMQIRERRQMEWTGDVWKAVVYLNEECYLPVRYTVNIDYGCHVIVVNKDNQHFAQYNENDFSLYNSLSYEYYRKNVFTEMFNLITYDNFMELDLNKHRND